MVLDPRSPQRFDHWHHRGFYYRPAWGRTATGGTSTATAAASGAPQLSLGQVAGSFAGWMENTAAGLASTIEPTKMGLESPAVRMVDLSGVDRVIYPAAPPTPP